MSDSQRARYREEKRRPAMARPSTGATDHSHTPCRGGRPRLAPLQGRPTAAKAVGATASKRRYNRPDNAARDGRQRPALPPVGAAAPAARVTAPWQGGCRSQGATATSAGAAVQ
ncbi:hypothetical protein BHE74_00037762 [Ensete ventricosum]|nr:hypothetical protein BHE74_00037762 [Ensete ventricosum]